MRGLLVTLGISILGVVYLGFNPGSTAPVQRTDSVGNDFARYFETMFLFNSHLIELFFTHNYFHFSVIFGKGPADLNELRKMTDAKRRRVVSRFVSFHYVLKPKIQYLL
jgi:hypothetical protein